MKDKSRSVPISRKKFGHPEVRESQKFGSANPVPKYFGLVLSPQSKKAARKKGLQSPAAAFIWPDYLRVLGKQDFKYLAAFTTEVLVKHCQTATVFLSRD